MILQFVSKLSATISRIWLLAITKRRFFGVLTLILALLLIPEASYAAELGCGNFDIPCQFAQLLYGLAGAFAFICGNILDLVVKFFVFEMSTTLESSALFTFDPVTEIPVYRQMWFIIRDLANLAFIFILIYAALATVFDVKNQQKVNVRRVIPQLILVAIVMNFSLFFVQVAVDFSNYLSYQFFTAVEIQVKQPGGTTEPAQIGANDQQGLSNIIMNVTRVTALVGTPADQDAGGSPGLAFGIFASLFTIIGALVMLAGAALLFIRFFMILIYMVGAPIALAMSIVEGGKQGLFKKWLKGLTAQLTFAPAYFFLLYLSLQFLTKLSFGAQLGDAGNTGLIAYWVKNAMIFSISATFLIFSLVYAQRLGAIGAKTVNTFTKRLGGAIIFGGTAAVSRNTIGRGARRYVNSNQDRLQQLRAQGGVRGKIATMQLKSAKSLRDKSYDNRLALDRIPGVRVGDISFGNRDSIKEGYDKRLIAKAKRKAEEAFDIAGSLTPEQREVFANKLESQNNRGRGFFQKLTYEEDPRTGKQVPRAWAANVNQTVNGAIADYGTRLENFVGGGDEAGVIKRKSANIVNRMKNSLLRNNLLLGGGIDDPGNPKKGLPSARQRLAQQIREEKDMVEIVEHVRGDDSRIADLQRELDTARTDVVSTRTQRDQTNITLEQAQRDLAAARAAGSRKDITVASEAVKAAETRLKEQDKAVEILTEKIDRLNETFSMLENTKEQNVVIRDQRIRELNNQHSEKIENSRVSRGGFVNTKAAQAVRNYDKTKAEKDSEEKNEKFLRDLKKVMVDAGKTVEGGEDYKMGDTDDVKTE